MKKIRKMAYYFYLNNYRGIHHLSSILILSLFLYLFGVFGMIGSGILLVDYLAPLVLLYFSYRVTEWGLESSGLNDSIIVEKNKLEVEEREKRDNF